MIRSKLQAFVFSKLMCNVNEFQFIYHSVTRKIFISFSDYFSQSLSHLKIYTYENATNAKSNMLKTLYE